MRALRVTLVCISAILACKGEHKPVPVGNPPAYEISVTEQGFQPARLEVKPGEAVVLRITRKVDPTCADAVDVQGDPVRHMLPKDVPVEVRLTAPASGEIAFACPMKMYKGAVVVTR